MPSATILIADISGYTDFAGRAALHHSSYVLRELLDLIIESVRLDLTISEIEGDAILFYRLGDPILPEILLKQCERTFLGFHERLKVIERDRVCQCGACEKASGLTLKFVIHYGQIEEITVSSFRKAVGIDMIVAHRLLKNSLPVHDYILASHAYRSASGVPRPISALRMDGVGRRISGHRPGLFRLRVARRAEALRPARASPTLLSHGRE